MDRVSETQLQVGENSDWIIWRLTQFPASNKENYFYLWKLDPFQIELFDQLITYHTTYVLKQHAGGPTMFTRDDLPTLSRYN